MNNLAVRDYDLHDDGSLKQIRLWSDGNTIVASVVRSEVFDEKGMLIARYSQALSPVPMILTCPACGERHIDKGKFETHPHHTHACQHCGMVWRPALVATVGVQFLPGFKD